MSLEVQVKLLATYRDFLPEGSQGNLHKTEAVSGMTAVELLSKYNVPVDGSSVILINGRTQQPDYALQEGDVVCAFPAIAGG